MSGDAFRIMVEIKQVETYLQRLRQVLEQAKKDQSPEVFMIHAEIKTVTARGIRLQDRYNEIARLQKENQQYLIAKAKQDERSALKQIRMHFKSLIPKQEADGES